MPSSPSPLLRLELQATGEQLNQWGDRLNASLRLAEQAIAGVLVKPLTGNTTLTVQNYVTDEARNATLIFTAGAGLVAAPTVTLPLAAKSWHIDNRCGYPITFTNGGTPVTVPAGRQADVFSDGANLFMLDPVAVAVTGALVAIQPSVDQAAASATSAASAAGTATSARNTTLTYRDTALSARDTAQASATSASSSAAAAATSAAGSAAAGSASAASAASAQGARDAAIAARDQAVAIVAGNGVIQNIEGSAQPGDLVVFDNTTGTIAKSSGIQIADIITSNYVVTPHNIAPAAGATGQGQNGNSITFQATDYSQLAGVAFKSRQFRIATDAAMTNIILDSGAITTPGTTYSIANPASTSLQPSTTYYWQSRYIDANDRSSNWSNATGFVTGTKFTLDFGDAFAGGFYGALVEYGGQRYRLVVADKASGQASRAWKTEGTTTAGTFSEIDGVANTALMTADTHPAADWCRAFRGGGFSDWYLPARKELAAIYASLKPTTTANDVNSGQNAYTVPPRSTNYTASDPAQTIVTSFRSSGGQDLAAVFHHSSTQANNSSSFGVNFNNGNEGGGGKTGAQPVRPVRRVVVA